MESSCEKGYRIRLTGERHNKTALQLHSEIISSIFARSVVFVSRILNASSKCLHMSLSTLTLRLGNLHSLANEHTSETSNMIGCFSPISSITVFLASLKHPSSTLDADVSIKSSSSSSASVVSSDSCYILDRRLRHKLEKKP